MQFHSTSKTILCILNSKAQYDLLCMFPYKSVWFFYVLKAEKITWNLFKIWNEEFPKCRHNGREWSLRANRIHRKD